MSDKIRFRLGIIVALILVLNSLLVLVLQMNNLHFYSSSIEALPYNLIIFSFFFLLLLIFIKNKTVRNLVIIFWSIVQVFAFLISTLRISGDGDIVLRKFKNLKEPLITYMYSSNGTMHFIKGKTYFFGILYSQQSIEEHDASSENFACNLEPYIIPEEMQSSKAIAVWYSEGLLLDFTNMIAQKAVLKKIN